jgi:Ca-activated chloride channel family protein
MRTKVAVFLVAVSLSFSAIAPAQTSKRRANKQRTNATPRSSTVKICQGVPIPDGYIIVGYQTSTACPHGAYVLKKQDADTDVSSVAKSNPPAPAPSAAKASRPRRVELAGTNNALTSFEGIGNTTLRKPTLANVAPSGVAVNSTAAPVASYEGEEVGEGEVLRIDTSLVTVPVSVMDRDGRFVSNLKKGDFTVLENGVEQSIAFFEATEKPFTVALLLDTSASTHFRLSEIKEAAIAFAKQLRPQDRVLVVTFNDEVLLLTEATNDANVINAVIEEYAYSGDSTRLYDAVDLVVRERLSKIQGRKAIVLFTDGVDTSSFMATYQSTLYQAEELDALIYPIQYDTSDYMQGGTITVVTNSSGWPFPGRRSSKTYTIPSNGIQLPGMTKADYERADQYLHALADKTGARLYKANDTAELSKAFAQIAEELRRQYSLGYYPQGSSAESGDQRQIRVRVRQPNLAVRARNSYLKRGSTTSTTP